MQFNSINSFNSSEQQYCREHEDEGDRSMILYPIMTDSLYFGEFKHYKKATFAQFSINSS